MNIIIKLLVKNIIEKKLRTFLILLSIVLSSAVFFSSMAISSSMVEIMTNSLRGSLGNSDIKIYPDEESISPFVYKDRLFNYMNSFEYAIEELNWAAVFAPSHDKTVNVTLRGIDINELKGMQRYNMLEESNLYPFEGKKVVIGRKSAGKYGYKAGDSFALKINSRKYIFTIAGIAEGGTFNDSLESMTAVVPRGTLGIMIDSPRKANLIYIKLKDRSNIEESLKSLSEEYKTYKVRETIPLEEIKRETASITGIFLVLSSIVFFMSIFIIYSSFKVITAERIPLIGALRSIGASRKMTDFILIGESILYGTAGGVLGSVLGVGILYLISYFMVTTMTKASSGIEVSTSIKFSLMHFIITFVMAEVLCAAGSIVPIVKISKISVKDIILRTVQSHGKNRVYRLVLGIILIVLSLLISAAGGGGEGVFAGGISMVLLLSAVVLLIPYITIILVRLFERVYTYVFGNVGVLAAKNLRQNKNILNNITMLTIGISGLLLINTVGYNNVINTTKQYRKAKYDIKVVMAGAGREEKNRISNIDGVQEIYGEYEFNDIDVTGKEQSIGIVKGISPAEFTSFWDFETGGDTRAVLEALDTGRNIIISKTLKSRLGVETGDPITLKAGSGEKEYKVIGLFESFMGSGDIALASERFIKRDMLAEGFSAFYIKTNKSPEEVSGYIEAEFSRRSISTVTKEELEQEEIDSSQSSMILMQGFVVLAIIIACFGVVNNLVISFIQRKHSMAVLRSVGMSKRQAVKMIFIEALTGGLIGGISGVLGGVLLIFILSLADRSTEVYYPLGAFVIYLVTGAVIMMAASISPALKSSKMDLVASLKYE